MKFTVLGCDGSFPGAHGACSGYLVSQENDRLQLDLGCGVLPELMALTAPEDLGAICITHWHNDHVSDMLALKYYLLINKKRIRVLASKEPHPIGDLLKGEEFHFEDISIPRKIAGFDITAIRTVHPLPAYALRIARDGKTLVYTGDAVGGEGLAGFCEKADLLVCDAAFTNAQWHEGLPHFSAAQAGKLARTAGVHQLLLTHAQPGSDKALLLKEASAEFPESIAAENGLTLTL